jgi:hypothetical protein
MRGLAMASANKGVWQRMCAHWDAYNPKDLFKEASFAAGAIHIVLAIVVLISVIGSPWDVPFAIRYSNWTETEENLRCGEGNNTCTISMSERDAGVFNVGILVPLFSFISGFHHLYAAWATTSNQRIDGNANKYLKTVVGTGANPWRAIDYALSSSLMIVVVSVLFRAPSDPMMLLVLACLQALTCAIGYAIEFLKGPLAPIKTGDMGEQPSPAKWLFGVAILAYSGLWISLLIPFGYAVKGAPPAVAVFIMFMVLSFSLFPFVFCWSWNFESEDDVLRRELAYTAASFLSKIPLLVLFWTGVVMRSGTVQFESDPDLNTGGSTLSDGELFGLFGGVVATCTALGMGTLLCANKLTTGAYCGERLNTD